VKLKPKKNIDCECDVKKSFLDSTLFLAIITILSGLLLALPYYSNVFYSKQKTEKNIIVEKVNLSTVEFKITGTSCDACTNHINSEFENVLEVISITTSYPNTNTIIQFDNTKISVDSLYAIIKNIGYDVTSAILNNN